MLKLLQERLRQGHRTSTYPSTTPVLPDRFRGLPILDDAKCPSGCRECVDACPTDALFHDEKGLGLDMGRCLFCTDCTETCPEGAIRFTTDHRLAVRSREDLIIRSKQELALASPLESKMLRLFGRSLRLRQISAGGDNASEADLNVLGTIVFDLSRFGVSFVASPRHADGLVITGPIPENMRRATLNCYESIPNPKIVIAVGVEAISGEPYRGNPEVHNGVGGLLPVDLYIPGFPPHPLTILDGLLRLLDRIEARNESIQART